MGWRKEKEKEKEEKLRWSGMEGQKKDGIAIVDDDDAEMQQPTSTHRGM